MAHGCARTVDGAPKPFVARLIAVSLVSMAALVSLFCTSTTARAGNWTVEYEVSGEASGNTPRADYSGYDNTPTQWQPLINNGELYLPLAGYHASCPPHGSGTATATNVGSVTVFAVWHPNAPSDSTVLRGSGVPSPPDLPPAKILVYERATVSGSGYGGNDYRDYSSDPLPTFALSNPLGNEVENSYNRHYQSVSGSKATTIDNSGRAERVLLASRQFSAVVTISSSAQWGSTLSAEASVAYNARIVQKSVGISRPGAHDEIVGADGTIYGDTVYSYFNKAAAGLFWDGHIQVRPLFIGRVFGDEWFLPNSRWKP